MGGCNDVSEADQGCEKLRREFSCREDVYHLILYQDIEISPSS